MIKRLSLLLLLQGLIIPACDKPAPVAPQAVPEHEAQQPETTPKPIMEPKMEKKEQTPHTSSIPATKNQMLTDEQIPDVTFKLATPKEDEVLQGNSVEITFSLDNYRVSKEIGQHIHVILDNEAYRAHYDATEPLTIKDLSPGTHVLRSFPARHYHLSLKEGDVFDTVVFHVGEKTEGFEFDKTKPYITYSRPKGEYSLEAAKEGLLLDFYVTNVTLGDDAKVAYSVDGGEEVILDKWEPVTLEPLEAGDHDIRLRLIDNDGNLIKNGEFNDTTRTITVNS